MKRVRFIMIGGFLGAGKTTAIARLARHYVDLGQQVGLVTNDQAYDLVDTQSLREQGFRVGEVPGACFCCKFDDLVKTMEGFAEGTAPDIVIAEPVGSCTDLVATVVQPLRRLYGQQVETGPLTVLLKPEHGRKILQSEQSAGFSPKAAYIFLKQIEEADVVAINKIDKLTTAQRDELIQLTQTHFPDKQILAVSAHSGEGFSSLIEAIGSTEPRQGRLMDVDYDIYAAGEAELGWLNCTIGLNRAAGGPFVLDDVLVRLVSLLQTAIQQQGAEVAHLKVLAQADGQLAIANLVGTDVDVELSRASGVKTTAAELIVNARVAIDPMVLEKLVIDATQTLAQRHNLSHEIRQMQRFRPAPPVPTHRMGAGTFSPR